MAKLNFGTLVQGAMGNFSEKSTEDLAQEFNQYLFDNEAIEMGFQLIRDVIIFTNQRIIYVDKQGTTGKKTAILTIFLDSIVHVEMEIAGFGIDDSEIEITYMVNTFQKAHHADLRMRKFEFPKKTDILPLYRYLGNVCMQNRARING
ncbi:hypothetical protein M2139_002018 [Enterococcus sp. PF1-24]|uniref:PH domain-containing protein n=1 Tax=unclassified Enterococcus TaxID=2608891 RepID=UPI002473DB11|nr:MULTISPECIES: PH domain-containing protein [unclassified Enterococcus]MDH6365017.1 hypothetical protein [Enterococcus sp. PFB1-1]MDH6402118.1 hypothetical protein [Enterococcus sp. PF1-24]